jgi:tetratricopeptide (TPR) repeat protein
MFFSFHQREFSFKAHDVLVFGDLIEQEIRLELQMPASIGFRFHEPAYWLLHEFSAEQVKALARNREDDKPVVLQDMLVIPLVENNDVQRVEVDLVIHDIDPDLLAKMDPEWMVEFRIALLQRLNRLRRVYIDPVTGLYNQYALECIIAGSSCWKSFFLIAAVTRTRSISTGLQKTVQLASLLEATTRDPLFYFGHGLFGHVSLQCDRKAALEFSHKMITRLKRERLRRVHIGFGCMESDQPIETVLERSWQALLKAEQRGPFSLCDADTLTGQEPHPLALPEKPVMRMLQRRWRGLSRFGLALLETADPESTMLQQAADLFPDDCLFVPASESRGFILLPEYSPVVTADTIKTTAGQISARYPDTFLIGFSTWPLSAPGSRTECVRQCCRAVLHAGFYGPGAAVCFDALSRNVSGDLYFDEGDYKQAIREYRAGLAMKPGDINLLNSLGVALAEVNRHREAIECFTRVLAVKPGNHMALVNKGMSCRQIGLDDEAVQSFEWALQSRDQPEQNSPELVLQLARLYCRREQYNRALKILEKWRRDYGAPREFLFFKLLGEAYLGTGRNRDAMDALQHSLRLHPRNADSLSMLGFLYVIENEGLELGLSLCDRAIGMDSNSADFYLRKAAALFHAKHLDQALSVVRKALQRKRKYGAALLLRGRIYQGLGAGSRAIQSFEQMLKVCGNDEIRAREARRYLEEYSAGREKSEVTQCIAGSKKECVKPSTA